MGQNKQSNRKNREGEWVPLFIVEIPVLQGKGIREKKIKVMGRTVYCRDPGTKRRRRKEEEKNNGSNCLLWDQFSMHIYCSPKTKPLRLLSNGVFFHDIRVG